MDVAIQAVLDARQALSDAQELFRTLENARMVAANISVGTARGADSSARAYQETAAALRQVAQEQINMASAMARQQAATGQLTAAMHTLEQALNTEGASTTSLINLETQLIRIRQQLAAQTLQQGQATQQQTNFTNSLLARVQALILGYLSLSQAVKLFNEIVASRIEMDRLEIGMKALTQDSGAAATATRFLIDETNRLGLSLTATIPEFVKMTAALTSSGLTFTQAEHAFTNIATATKALGLSSATTGRILFDLQEMASIGTVQMRQLRQMIMQMPGALQAFADAAGMSTEQFMQAVHHGLIDPSLIATKGLDALAQKYAHEMPEAMDTLESHVNRLKNAWTLLTAEMGKTDAIKKSADFLTETLERAQAVLEMRGKGLSSTDDSRQNKLEMSLNFPKAKAFGEPGDFQQYRDFSVNPFNFGMVDVKAPDMVATYIRMRKEQAAYDQQEQQKKDAAAEVTGVRPMTEEQEQALEKIGVLRERIHAETMQGLDKELEQIEINGAKQVEELDKYYALLGKRADQDTKAKDYLAVAVGVDALKTQARDKEDAKSFNEGIAQTKDDAQKISDIMTSLIPDDTLRKSAEIDANFEKIYETVRQIQDRNPDLVPKGALDAVDAAKKRALDDLRLKKSPTSYLQEDFGNLEKQRNQLKESLLTESDAQKFDKIAQQIQEISQAMALKLHGNAVSIADSFKHGFASVTESFGSFSERMAKVGETVAGSMESNFTDAFTAMIMGTKSASAAFSEMATQIVADLVRVMVEQMIVRQIMSLFGGAGGSGGFVGDAGGGIGVAGLAHRGGVIGAGMNTTPVSWAPRFHSGSSGLVGDEVAVVARRKEVMYTPEQMKALGEAMADAGGRNNQKIEIVNYFDMQQVDDHLARNPRAILNPMIKERKTIAKMFR